MLDIILVKHLIDINGYHVIKVQITNHHDRYAWLDKEDFDLVESLGVRPIWKIWSSEVCTLGREPLQISRIIMDAGPKHKVIHLNHDPTDLRKQNLALDSGGGRYRTRDLIDKNGPSLRKQPTIRHVFDENGIY